jgi:hypothetical protein
MRRNSQHTLAWTAAVACAVCSCVTTVVSPAGVTLLNLTGDAASSSASGWGGSIGVTLTDGFTYAPLSPTSPLPNQSWSGSRGFHGDEANGVDVILNYTLTAGTHTTVAGEEIVVDLYGRNSNEDRDDNVDVLLLNGGVAGATVASVTGVAIEGAHRHARATLSGITAGTQFDAIRVVGHDTAASKNLFTLMEMRVVSFGPEAPGVTLPATDTVGVGWDLILTAGLVGYPAPGLQWYTNGMAIVAATNNPLVYPAIQLSQSGLEWSLVATNVEGTASATTLVTVVTSPPSVSLPASTNVVDRDTLTLTAVLGGAPPPALQWYTNGTVVAGATSNPLVYPDIRLSQSGLEWSLVATNILGTASSTTVVAVVESPVYSTNNVAFGKLAYMARYHDSLPPASHANDADYATEAKTTSRAVDAHWEVDLGASYSLRRVHIAAATGFEQRMSHATVRLFDEDHDSVFSQHLSGVNPTFDVDPGHRHARFVRVGFENKERSHPSGGIEWYLGIKEVGVLGRPSHEVGVVGFSASTNAITGGESVTLTWQIEELDTLDLYPGGTSVLPFTDGNGNGTLLVAPTSSVEYLLVGAAPHGTYRRAVTVTVDGQVLTPRISEFVADNRLSLRDGRGDASDWIELYNPNNTPLDMGGYGLSDRADLPMKWVFPATNMPAHGRMIVFASGRNNPVDDEGWLHADFNLDVDGESLVLTAPDGSTTLDAITNYPGQTEDLAYGRTLDGGLTFIEPTPLEANMASTYQGWLEELDFSHTRGFYTNAFSLVITNANTNATVHYSLDGKEPSVPYSSALPIASTACLRASVTRVGYKSPRVKTHTFVFVDDVLTSSVMNQGMVQSYPARARQGLLDLPTFSVVVPDVPNNGNTNDYVEREASVELIWPGGTYNDVQSDCGLSRFGGAWTTFSKKNYRLKFRTEYGDRKFNAPLFNGFDRGFRAEEVFDSIDLRGAGHDMEQRGFYMSARFAEDLMLDMGSINPHGRFVHLYINGTYWGQYHARERLVDRFLADYLGGSAEDYVTVRGNDNNGSSFILGMPDPPKLDAWQHVLDYRGDYANQAPYLDASHLIDFMLAWLFGNCESEYRAAGPVTAGSGFKFWIADADGYLRDNSRGPGNKGPANILGDLVTEGHPDFMMLMADRIYKHFFNDGALTPARNEARLNTRMDEVYSSLVDECARWGQRTPDNWETAAQDVSDGMFQTRPAQLFNSLRSGGYYPTVDPPVLNLHGGTVSNGFQVTLNSGSGTIYYMPDGSDPRLPGGAIAPGALAVNAFTVTNDIVLSTRVWTGTEWSALSEAQFLLAERRPVSTGDVAITEVHYDPAAGDAYEFIEIRNASASLVDFTGATFSDGVDFWFPDGFGLAAGEFAVVVEDLEAFSNRYQNATSVWYRAGINVVGQWSGALADEGERIALSASNGTEILVVRYRDGRGWPLAADGAGHSLVPTGQVDALDYGGNWRASRTLGGSPGAADPEPPASVVLNEIAAHTDTGQPPPNDSDDWIELYNPLGSTEDIGGWWLSDDRDDLKRYQIPPGTVIAAQGFLLLTESLNFHTNRIDGSGFGLDKAGERVFLSYLPGDGTDRVVDAKRFKGQENGTSLGRRPDGGPYWYTLSQTPGAANTGSLERVLISQIMYHPAPTAANPENNTNDEYVEVHNPQTVAVPLWTTAGPWRIDGGIGYTFPSNTTLQAGARLMLVSFDPVTNTVARDAFLEHYLMTNGQVRMLGPYSGQLDNRGDRVALERPQEADPPGLSVSWVIVDEVIYFDRSPWPTGADGSGIPLYRIDQAGAGNDPANWAIDPPGAEQFRILAMTVSGGVPTISWEGLTTGVWYVERSTNLLGGFVRVATSTTVTVHQDSGPPAGAQTTYYRIAAMAAGRPYYTQNVVGHTRLSVPASAYSLVAMPFRKIPHFEGTVSANTPSLLSDSNAAWTPGQFAPGVVGQEAAGTSTFCVEIRDSANAHRGRRFAITANSAVALTIAGGASAGLTNNALAGAAYAIVAEQRVRDIFGEPGAPLLAGGAGVLDGDNVLFWSGASWERIYYKDSGNPPYLRNHWLLGSLNVDDRVVPPNAGLFVHRRAPSNGVLHVIGELPRDDQWIDLHAGHNLVGGGWTDSPAILDTDLENVIGGGSTSGGASTILEWGGTSWLAPVYYKTGGFPPFIVGHWVRGTTPVDTSFHLVSSQGYFIKSTTNTVWRKERP